MENPITRKSNRVFSYIAQFLISPDFLYTVSQLDCDHSMPSMKQSLNSTVTVPFAQLPASLVSLFLLLSLISTTQAQPAEFQARYEADAYGITAEAERSLTKIGDNRYRLRNKIEAGMLGNTLAELDESSEFDWQEGRVIPKSYSYIQSGISQSIEQIQFDWEYETALSIEDDESWPIPLEEGVIDKLSYQLQIREYLNSTDETEFRFQVIDSDEIESHLYGVVAEEIFETELGRLNTVKIERVRDPSDARTTTIWLASDWEYLLVGLVQTDRRGRKVELKIDAATVNGEVVQSLP